MSLLQRVVDTINHHALFRDGNRVLVALSGGADSVALLFLLRELADAGELTIAGAAHFHHGLRGAEADADEAFCAALASRLNVAFVAGRGDVAALAREHKRSLEDAARRARYAFLAQAASGAGADAIVVAHTEDDQAETFLLRLLRGAGGRGLGSIRPRAGQVIRPFIDIPRAALRDYLAGLGEAWREDASNNDVRIVRNRVRHELIPVLQSRFSPAIVPALAREAALARQDEDFLHQQAIELARRIVLTEERLQIRIDAHGLAAAPRALGSRVVLHALEQLAGRRPISFEHVEAVLRLGPGQAVSLPAQDAVRTGDVIALRPRKGRGLSAPNPRRGESSGLVASEPRRGERSGLAAPKPRRGEGGNGFAVSLSIPGEVELQDAGLAVAAERLDTSNGRPTKWEGRGSEVGVAAGAVQLPLAVRGRRPGDRFHPLGAPGARKLQDFLVDRKVARDERDTVPLVVDGRDRIVWVVGQSVAEDFRVTDPSRGVILLKVRHLGGAG